MHQRSSLKKFEEEKSDNITVKLCLSILIYKAITRVNKPSHHTTRLNQFKYNLVDSKFESPNVLLLNHYNHIRPLSSVRNKLRFILHEPYDLS